MKSEQEIRERLEEIEQRKNSRGWFKETDYRIQELKWVLEE